jgi:hypothetical protein
MRNQNFSGVSVASATTDPFQNDLTLNNAAFTVGANGNKYCKVSSVDMLNTTLSAFLHVWYLANNVCTDSLYKCSSAGVLSVYSAAGCQGTAATFTLTAADTALPDNAFGGSTTATLVTISGGTETAAWVAEFPFALLLPLYKDANEVLSIIFAIAVLVAAVGHTVAAGMKLVPFKAWNMAVFICLLFWITYSIMWLVAWNIIIVEQGPNDLTYTAIYFFLNIASLFNVLIVNNFMVKLLVMGMNKWVGYAVMSIPILLHLGLGFGNYLFYIVTFSWYYEHNTAEDDNVSSIIYFNLIKDIYPWWLFSMFVWDTLAPVLICLKLLRGRDESLVGRMKRLFSVAPPIPYLIVMQILTFVLYVIFYYAPRTTIMMGSTRASTTVQSAVLPNLLLMHALFNIAMAAAIRKVSQDPRYASSNSQQQGSSGGALFGRVFGYFRSLAGGSNASSASKSHGSSNSGSAATNSQSSKSQGASTSAASKISRTANIANDGSALTSNISPRSFAATETIQVKTTH